MTAPINELSWRLLGIINANWQSQAVYAAAELRIADLLARDARSSRDLAEELGADQPFLHRLLLMLVSLDICTLDDDGRFGLTPMGELLRAGSERSLRAWTLYWGGALWPVLGKLADSVRTGTSGRELLHGAGAFDVLQRDPAAAAIFNQAMVELTSLIIPSIVAACDVPEGSTIVDVGGGYGQLLAALLAANPTAKGVLVDMAHAIETAGSIDRCELVVGDFFTSVPAGGDIYLLKSILHDWPDDQAARILATVRAAMKPDARLFVIERMLPDRFEASDRHQALARADLVMMIELGSRERTDAEFRSMFTAAGLEVIGVVPVADFHLIEARPAS